LFGIKVLKLTELLAVFIEVSVIGMQYFIDADGITLQFHTSFISFAFKHSTSIIYECVVIEFTLLYILIHTTKRTKKKKIAMAELIREFLKEGKCQVNHSVFLYLGCWNDAIIFLLLLINTPKSAKCCSSNQRRRYTKKA